MLTLFTIPKPFRGHTGIIQRNAIRSWTLLYPRPEIMLFGNDEGTAQISRELGVGHGPEVARNDYGTPLLNDLFDKAQQLATHHVICYANADIVLMSDFIKAVGRVARSKGWFLMVGQRCDLNVGARLDFRQGWEQELRLRVAKEGHLHPPSGIDYFVFPRGLWGEIPPFSLGRTVWDNWLLYRARSRGASLIDATPSVLVVHQNHDYSHIPEGEEGAWGGVEARHNQELAGGSLYPRLTLEDATHILTPERVKRVLDWQHVYRQLQTLPVFHPHLRLPVRLLVRAIKLSDRLHNRFGTARSHC